MRRMLAWFKNVRNLKLLLTLNEEQAARLAEQERKLADRGRSLHYLQNRVARQRKALTYLHGLAGLLSEPKEQETCGKIRLRDQPEADAMARQLEREMQAATGRFIPRSSYACGICPRHPFTLNRFWHVRRDRSAEEIAEHPSNRSGRAARVVEQREEKAARARGEYVAPVASPEALAGLKKKFNGGK